MKDKNNIFDENMSHDEKDLLENEIDDQSENIIPENEGQLYDDVMSESDEFADDDIISESAELLDEDLRNEDGTYDEDEEEIDKLYDIAPEPPELEVAPKKKKSGFKGSFVSYVIVIIIASFLGGLLAPFVSNYLYPPAEIKQEVSSIDLDGKTPTPLIATDTQELIPAIVKKALPSVVSVRSTSIIDTGGYGLRPQEGIGSGVIIDPNGNILTNSHVISFENAESKSIKVHLSNDEEYPATVVWDDPNNDLALIKIDAPTVLPYLELGDSDAIEIGELAVAIGTPVTMEFRSTVTSGIVSGLNRNVGVQKNSSKFPFSSKRSEIHLMRNLIQTDASINGGNSGGPLLNSKGQIIGINTVKVASAEGIGFSIPINLAKPMISKIESNNFKTVVLGIAGRDVADYEKLLGIELPIDSGLVVLVIAPDEPADIAGILHGDIITKLGDKDIADIYDLKRELMYYTLEDETTVTVIRNGKEKVLNVKFTVEK